MDLKLQNEIKRLEYSLELYHTSYMQELEDYEEKMQRLEFQIEKCNSDVKREILLRQRENYEQQISRLDENMEKNTNTWKEKIERYKSKLADLEKEKRSLEYNVDRLNKALGRRDVNEIFDMFEYITNAITILNEKITSCSQAHEPVS
jgi:chromosome segregation ATPase